MTEWYRQTEWSPEIEETFFAKLARARSQRDQYLVIQALTLSDSFPDVTLKLVDLYFETRTETFHDSRASLAAARSRFAKGGHVEALDAYLETLSGQGCEGALTVSSPIEFAFLAARYRSKKHYAAALEHLASVPAAASASPDIRFRLEAARALLLSETGADPAGAVQDARSALSLPEDLLSHYSDVTWRLRGIVRA